MTEPEPDTAAIRKALREIVTSNLFVRSPQLIEFLKYIVDAKLSGQEEKVKAYAIAVDVFGRPEDFDPQYDSIVRVQARRLRELLAQFYVEADHQHLVRITLPVGRYVPEFSFPARNFTQDSTGPVPQTKRKQAGRTGVLPGVRQTALVGAIVSAMVAISVMVLLALRLTSDWNGNGSDQPAVQGWDVPIVAVSDFVNQTDMASAEAAVGDFKLMLAANLARFDNLVLRVDVGQSVLEPESDRAQFVLSGVVRSQNGMLVLNLLVTRGEVAEVVWSDTLEVGMAGADPAQALQAAALRVAYELGSTRGTFHRPAIARLPASADEIGAPTAYMCRLLYDQSLGHREQNARDLAEACLVKLLADGRSRPAAEIALVEIRAENLARNSLPDIDLADRFFELTNQAREIVTAAPNNSFVQETFGHIYRLQGDVPAARAAFERAMEANPANLSAYAALGVTLGFNGQWEEGAEFALTAIELSSVVPAWFYVVPSLDALRRGDYEQALEWAQQMRPDVPMVSNLVGAAASGLGGRPELISRFRAGLLNDPILQEGGIMTEVRLWIEDESLLMVIKEGLLFAGVPASALNNGFAAPENHPEYEVPR